MQLKGQAALVVGAASVIGRASCLALAAAGVRVTAVDHDPAGLADLVALLRGDGVEVAAECVDAGDEAGLASLVTRTEAAFGAIGVAHHIIAPQPGAGSILAEQIATFDSRIASELGGVFLTMRYVLPRLCAHGRGTLAVSCSVAALAGLEGATSTVACDHAALGLVRAAAMDVAAQGVTVNAICHLASPSDQMLPAEISNAVADALLFLASPMARSITGSHFVIDGGQSVVLAPPRLALAA